MTTWVEPASNTGFLLSEENGYASRETATIGTNQTIAAGQVLGKTGATASESSTVAAGAGNAGNGALTVSSLSGAAIDGVYNVLMLNGGAAAVFEVSAPDGSIVGVGKVGTPFSGPINFSIAAGGVDFAAGDLFRVTVARPVFADVYKAWDPTATDGSQVACGIAFYALTTGASQGKLSVFTRRAVMRKDGLTFAAGATTAQINEAIVQLDKRGITLR